MAAAPVQTPCVFIDKGGAAHFDEDCNNALLKCGYDPNAFGTYSHVQKQISAAKAKCDKYDAAKAAGKETGPPPTDSERYLSKCQAGHLSQDGTHRQSGGRNDNCKNLNDGYDTNKSPCMPQSAGSQTPGSEHNAASKHEMASADAARADAKKTGKKGYDPALRDAHERDRIKKVVDTSDKNAQRKPIDRETWKPRREGASEKGGATGGASSPGSAAGAAPDGAESSSLPADQATKDKAVECIDAFRKAGLAAMERSTKRDRAQGADDAQKSYDSAGGAKKSEIFGREEAKHKAKVDALRKKRDSAVGRANSHKGHADKARKAGDQKKAAEHDAKAAAADKERQNMNALLERQEKKRARAEKHQDNHNQSKCKAEEGRRVSGRSGDPPRTGNARAPSTQRGWAGKDYGRSDAKKDAGKLGRKDMGVSDP